MIKTVYTKLWRPVLFRQDPEVVHDRFVKLGVMFGRFSVTRGILSFFFNYKNKMLESRVAGIKFQNPIGLAAGFDKDARLTSVLPSIGFGYEEIGSITGTECPGNPKPRLWRLPKDKGLMINYGLKSKGSRIIAKELHGRKFKFPVGVSIARANNSDIIMDIKKGIADYIKGINNLKEIGDYITINISCPNTPENQAFSTCENFKLLMEALDNEEIDKPLFIKMKPDLSEPEIDRFIEICDQYKFVTGFIVTNLTKDRERLKTEPEKLALMKGSASGAVLQEKSNSMIKYMYSRTRGRYVLIGVGGIFNASDAYTMIKNGASLLQLVTGMIYKGPTCISDINKGLVRLLKKDGYKNISEAVGQNHAK